MRAVVDNKLLDPLRQSRPVTVQLQPVLPVPVVVEVVVGGDVVAEGARRQIPAGYWNRSLPSSSTI